MRQVLPMKPLASAMRYGPSFFGYWKNFVLSVQGLKHCGSAAGPETTLGPAARAEPAMAAAAKAPSAAVEASRNVRRIGSSHGGLQPPAASWSGPTAMPARCAAFLPARLRQPA